ncbi:uncharacterized protein LOC141637470 [Silene latifolia]|uniref:uncharacterized protein LOC141637470 n=1 Tax=Silene latifolia TaxID=37657 RepID=UPI003D7811AD
MLENPMDSSVKRYAPPNQRNRGLNRRKSTDESERASNLHSSDGETNLGTGFRRAPSIDSSDGGSNKSAYESFHPRLIALNGCCASEASQLLHQRWKAAIHCYDDPTIDLTERQVMYTESASSAWGSFRLPHQLMSAPQMDFLAELQQAIDNSQRKVEVPKY